MDEEVKDSHREVAALPPTHQERVQEETKGEVIELSVEKAADHVIDSGETQQSTEIVDEKVKASHREAIIVPPALQEIAQEETKEEVIELSVKRAADHVVDLEELTEEESLLHEEIELWTNYSRRRVDEEFGVSEYEKKTIQKHINQTLDRIVSALESNHKKQDIVKSSTARLLRKFKESGQLRKYLISKISPSCRPVDSLNLSLLMKDISEYCLMLLKSKPKKQNKLLSIFPECLTKHDLNCEEGVRDRLNEVTKSMRNNDSQESLIKQAHIKVVEKHCTRVFQLKTFAGNFQRDVHGISAIRYLLGEVDKTSDSGKAYYHDIPLKDAFEIYSQYSSDMNKAIVKIEKKRHYKRALEKKDEIIEYLMAHPMYKKDGAQIYYDEQGNPYSKKGGKIYRLDGNEELFFVQEGGKEKCYYLDTASNRVDLPISNRSEITPFVPLFETFLKTLGLQLPDLNELVDSSFISWFPESELQSRQFEEAFKECNFTPSITVQNPLSFEAVTDLKLMPTEDDFTRSAELAEGDFPRRDLTGSVTSSTSSRRASSSYGAMTELEKARSIAQSSIATHDDGTFVDSLPHSIISDSERSSEGDGEASAIDSPTDIDYYPSEASAIDSPAGSELSDISTRSSAIAQLTAVKEIRYAEARLGAQ